MTTIFLIPHMDAGDRTRWTGDQDLRPLTELGRRQAAAIAQTLAGVKLDALYSSPAARCTQTLQPLAGRDGLEIEVAAGLREQQREDENDRAFAARSLAAITEILASQPGSTVAVCSHGDVIPAAVTGLVNQYGLPPVEPIRTRGQMYSVRVTDDAPALELLPVPPVFPAG